jgi:hypothetical protein
MRTQISHPALLLISLTAGLLAMWAVASPVGATGDLVTGGWTKCVWGYYYACSSKTCDTETCTGSWLVSCSACEDGACTGGYITMATCTAGGSWFAYPGGASSCYGTGCNEVHDATCY